jgi:hypothetical protein
MGVSLEEGERMHSTDMGEDMVVRSKRRWTPGVICTVLWKDEDLWELDSGGKSIEALWF